MQRILNRFTSTLLSMPHSLRFLDFDLSEDADGLRTWSALAAPLASHSPALRAEVQALLNDLTQHLGPAGPVDEGHAWDLDLDEQEEADTASAPRRTSVSLHLTGGESLADRLALWSTPA